MKIKTITFLFISTLILCVCISCEKDIFIEHEYQKEIMVFGFLHEGETISQERGIRISWTQPVHTAYDTLNARISNATVTINNGATTWQLEQADTLPGIYYNENVLIQPATEYYLTIEIEDQTLTAKTTVPPKLGITTDLNPADTNYVVQKNLGYEMPIYLESDSPERIIYTEITCNEEYTNAEYINPFTDDHKFPETREEYDGGNYMEPRRIRAPVAYRDLVAPPFNNEHVIYWYASMIVFYGSNTLKVIAIDDNYHHYLLRENPVYEGGIVGGLGVFGSLSGEKYELNVLKE